ncbi:MAG: ABC transporter permease subunit [Caldilineaceae bacterium]
MIIPGAYADGVFLLRQYMLTIPDELIDSARIDGANEWRAYWQIVVPLAAPALAVLGHLLRHVALERLPVAVDRAQPQRTLHVAGGAGRLPGRTQRAVALHPSHDRAHPAADHDVFAFLQRFITTGIATTGMK